jgi:hypothetical protein
MGKEKTTVRLVTPTGVGQYVFLNEPQTKFDPAGVYNVSLLVALDNAKTLMSQLDEQVDLALNKANEEAKPQKRASLVFNKPYDDEYDEDGNTTGNIVFKFKLSAKYTTKDGTVRERKPVIVDSQKKEVTDIVGSGSKLKVAFNARPYYVPATNAYGVSCYLSAVQVLELASFEGGGDFDVVEEGFVATTDSPKQETDSFSTPEDSHDF